jgi:apolipoprotein N-acyltransferase
MAVSLFSLFWMVELLPEQAQDNASDVFLATLLLTYSGLWLWMLFDHIFAASNTHVALIAILLIVGGGIAGIGYFFLVFRPRELSQQLGDVDPNVGV